MAKPISFAAYALLFDGSATPRLKNQHIHLQEGRYAAVSEKNTSLYLAGGFPSFAAESEIPLSPTLKLNADLGVFSDTDLQKIATAELNRHTATRFRTYILNPDPGLIVLAADRKRLTCFLDTYGGILAVQPLLTQGYHPDFTTADTLRVDCTEDGCTLTYRVKTPILTEQCTYCGACGPVCPEDCLSPQLFLDFSRCTLCNACVSACPENAVDLHAVEQRSIAAPAVLILGDPPAGLPEHDAIYQESGLTRFLATIGEYQVDEVIGLHDSICHYHGAHDVGCRLCADVCPVQAVSLSSEGVRVDQRACIECGNCIATCPTGALQYLRFSDSQFFDYLAGLDLERTATIVIGTEEQLHTFWWRNRTSHYSDTFFLEYPNPHALSTLHLLALYEAGFTRLFCITDPGGEQDQPFHRQVEQTNLLIRALDGIEQAVCAVSLNELNTHLNTPEPHKSRQTYVIAYTENRRKTLATLLAAACRTRTMSPATFKGEHFATFGTIICDEDRCTQCLACLSCCPVESLQADEERFALLATPALCVQCGTCMALCPENALNSLNGLVLEEDFFLPRVLSRAEPLRCKDCGKIFGTRSSLERIHQLLAARQGFDPEILTRCETCRVVHIFKAENR